MELISVIIPVYNVEKYLRKCLDSVVNQTYRNLEIIIVDDGSPDNCGSICDEYAEKDNRIQVIHKANEGLSAARNDALKRVKGDWISFVDSDDWCELNMYEKAIEAARKEDVDILIYNLFRNFENKEVVIKAFSREFVTNDRKLISEMQLSALNKGYTPYGGKWSQGYPWDKLFKASLVLQNGLIFDTKVKANEDVIFDLHAFQFAKKISYIDEELYHYRANPNSIGMKYTPDRVDIDFQIYQVMNDIGEKYHLEGLYYQALNARIVENTVLCGVRCFFHKKNKENIIKKLKYANKVLHKEPVYTAFDEVDKNKLGKIARFVLLSRHHNVLLLFVGVKVKEIYEFFK
ncbi:MAG: glycosyltransferase [Clostridiales bacterium]|nr:glycosyltransferase [Clostridiales bacterium]